MNGEVFGNCLVVTFHESLLPVVLSPAFIAHVPLFGILVVLVVLGDVLEELGGLIEPWANTLQPPLIFIITAVIAVTV